MQLPSFLKTPAVAIIGDHCYTSLIENLNYHDVDCIKLGISKGLGIGIVLGGSIVKVPQIIKIVSAGSAQGISFPSYFLETLASVVSLAYNFRNNNPLSTYGETFFVTIQNLIIIALMLSYSRRYTSAIVIISSFLFLGSVLSRSYEVAQVDGTVLNVAVVSMDALTILQFTTLPINLISKVPQIIENYQNGSTGQLAAFTVFNYFAGSLARVYTTLTEVDDTLILASFLLSTFLNCVLAFQMAFYWTRSSHAIAGEKGDGSGTSDAKKRVRKLD
ncbi:mannose-P-dolichol utilization defect 1 protein [Mortierella sp. GBAus27b]|nr:hypothetical protein BGX31_003933 [Mortierella sp. GBA43]KAI8359479.1 mannose-P-dolichol utilization defect 1 protein [Mortierella sp. GBAus27b]